jgi:hypothetical protein
MPKTITKSHKPGASPENSNGKDAPAKKVPIRDTLPPETDPEILEANRLFLEAVADVRENLANNFEPEPAKEL